VSPVCHFIPFYDLLKKEIFVFMGTTFSLNFSHLVLLLINPSVQANVKAQGKLVSHPNYTTSNHRPPEISGDVGIHQTILSHFSHMDDYEASTLRNHPFLSLYHCYRIAALELEESLQHIAGNRQRRANVYPYMRGNDTTADVNLTNVEFEAADGDRLACRDCERSISMASRTLKQNKLPKCSQKPKAPERYNIHGWISSITSDYNHLSWVASTLREDLEKGIKLFGSNFESCLITVVDIEIIMHRLTIIEKDITMRHALSGLAHSQTSLEQAESVRRLTKLALVFLSVLQIPPVLLNVIILTSLTDLYHS
jgi:hypothetical protein